MKKKILSMSIILGIVFLIIRISKIDVPNNEYYRYVADTIVGFYHNDQYNERTIRSKDRVIIKKYLSHLTHENEEICLDDYMIKTSDYYTNKPNSQYVYKVNDKCYIKYNNIGFDKYTSEDHEIEPYREIICDNYRIILYESMFYPKYSDTKNNPKYDYYFETSSKNLSTYSYTYQSSYDGTYLIVSLVVSNKQIIDIKINNTNGVDVS